MLYPVQIKQCDKQESIWFDDDCMPECDSAVIQALGASRWSSIPSGREKPRIALCDEHIAQKLPRWSCRHAQAEHHVATLGLLEELAEQGGNMQNTTTCAQHTK
jgi:hypothetical protein